ncbi:multicopper oxidase family protein [Sphaerisporangium corydalis]|uniref:Multicopper oxidase CueO n=1 Tax=Sphaerisporangium corydalis TaxID=1441875 RepID=A0ABV9EJA7_9ACTN|nr:multicopper oxidase family protein [Sphaerisporangium corydalis]
MSQTRRDFLRMSGGAGLLVGAAAWGAVGCQPNADPENGSVFGSDAKSPKMFAVPLPIPPVLKPSRSDGSTDYYDIVQKVAKAEILPGLATTVWAYNGIFPGPTIDSRSGRRIVVRHRNELPVPTTTHLHGGHTPSDSDGYPLDLVTPVGGGQNGTSHGTHRGMTPVRVSDGAKDYTYPQDQRAATLWYHDHRMDFTGPSVYRGLAGFHILRDDEEDSLPLPKGEYEVPLMIADRSFSENGEFLYPAADPTGAKPGLKEGYDVGVLGDVILVNGAPWPILEVAAVRYRFRLLNASNARRYRLTFDQKGAIPFVQIGSDGGLLKAPLRRTSVTVAPAERYDVVVDFSKYRPGTEITMLNGLGDDSTAQVMKFRVTRKATDDSTIPARLSQYETLDPGKAVKTRDFAFERGDEHSWTINGETYEPGKNFATPRIGDVEIWNLDIDGANHPVHLHLDQFQVLGDDERKADAGLKDTVGLTAGQKTRIIVKFTGYEGRYMLHCHNLEHEDMGMMADYEVSS